MGRKMHSLYYPYSWDDASKQEDQHAEICEKIIGWTRHGCEQGIDLDQQRINILWCAGSGGFAMNEEQLVRELASFDRVLGLLYYLQNQVVGPALSFHMVSSAGGLFEGQVHVDSNTPVRPIRPYGELKRLQEEHLAMVDVNCVRHIYRPSTVYGFGKKDKRIGLVAKLLWDKLNNRVTHIFGSLETIRDYVFVEDIARFVAGTMRVGHNPIFKIHTLASGKPTSINEILNLINRVTPGRTYLLLKQTGLNIKNNSFSRSCLPVGWCSTDLETGIRQVYHRMVQRGFWD